VLLNLSLPSDSSLLDPLSTAERLGLAGSPYSSVSALLVDARSAVVGGLVDGAGHVRTEADFAALVERARSSAEPALRDLLGDVTRVLDGWRAVDKLLSGRAEMALLPALADMKAQLGRLVHAGFLSEAGPEQLRRYPTYLRAMTLRREALDQGGAAVNRDRQLMDRVAELQDGYLHQLAALPEGRPPGERLRRARWMLEEYRVSLWAQQLGTAHPVSDERIRKVLSP
jgi:ATP-dependent helicase HrpA